MNGCTFWYTNEYYMTTAELRLEHTDCFSEVRQLQLRAAIRQAGSSGAAASKLG